MTIATVLQVTGNVDEPVSTLTLVLFWSGVIACVALFFYFLKRTDNIINEEAKLSNQPVQADIKLNHEDVHEEEAAAIALAIHMYKSDMHDMDSFTITLRKVSRIYSPWSSKIYTLRQNPR